MAKEPVIAIFDIGKTNKKGLLFDRWYRVCAEISAAFPEIPDDDGFPSDDLPAVGAWMKKTLHDWIADPRFDLRAVNFSAYGASLVHLAADGSLATPFYNYLKELPGDAFPKFLEGFGGPAAFSEQTASPALGLLNSGFQLWWLRHYKPDLFARVRHSLHLPQYFNYLLTGRLHADYTSAGCHTGLWDFRARAPHAWVAKEGIGALLPPVESSSAYDRVVFAAEPIPVGIGLHDSSAALIPYMKTGDEPFVLLSTGTWNIAINPFPEAPLARELFSRDCLYFLLDREHPVAASRIFLGYELEQQAAALAALFGKSAGDHHAVRYDPEIVEALVGGNSPETTFFPAHFGRTGPFPDMPSAATDLSRFRSFEEACHKLLLDLAWLQTASIRLVSGRATRRLLVEGGFSRNEIFLRMLRGFLPGWSIFLAGKQNGAALGAALCLHEAWNTEPVDPAISALIPFNEPGPDLARYRFASDAVFSRG